MHAETVDQLESLPWRAVVLRHFEEEMRITPKIHALIAIPYVRTEQLRFACCVNCCTDKQLTIMFGNKEYDSEERKRSEEEKVLLMMSLREFMICEGVAVACTKRRDALCFVRFILEQMSVPALNTCGKMLREGKDLALRSAIKLSSKQANAGEYEKTCRTRTPEQDR